MSPDPPSYAERRGVVLSELATDVVAGRRAGVWGPPRERGITTTPAP